MAEHILTDLIALLNQQTASQEVLTLQLSKIEALAEVLLNTKFSDNPIPPTQYNYIWVLYELVHESRIISEHAFNLLLKNGKHYLH